MRVGKTSSATWVTGNRILAILGALSVVGVAACGSAGNSGGGSGSGPIKAKMGFLQNTGTTTYNSAEQFAKLVSQYTNGKVQVTIYPNGELGSPDDEVASVQDGTEAFYASPTLDTLVPAVDTLALPYLFPNDEVGFKVIEGPTVRKLVWDKFPAHGMKFLGSWSLDLSDTYTVSKPINSPSDLAGLRIRVFEPGTGVPQFNALHADGVVIPSTQVVTALATHTIDGADDPPSPMAGSKWTASGGYLAITHDILPSEPVMVSEKFWKSLNSSEQAAVQKAVTQTLAPNLAAAQKSGQAAEAQIAAGGVKITHPNIAAFKAAVQPAYKAVEAKFGSIVPQLQAAVAQASK